MDANYMCMDGHDDDMRSIVPIDPMGHNIVEVICRNKAIVIQIGLGKHLLQLLLSHILS